MTSSQHIIEKIKLKNCCCCISLRKGAFFLGILGVIYGVYYIVTSSLNLVSHKVDTFFSNMERTEAPEEEEISTMKIVHISQGALILLSSLCLLIGAYKQKRLWLLPNLLLFPVNMLSFVILAIIFESHILLVAHLVESIIGFYFWLCILSYWYELTRKQTSVEDRIVEDEALNLWTVKNEDTSHSGHNNN